MFQDNNFDQKDTKGGQTVDYQIPMTTSSFYPNTSTRPSHINSGIIGVAESKAMINNLYNRL